MTIETKSKHPREVEAKKQKAIREKIIEVDRLEKECIKRTPEILSDPNLLINTVKEVQKEVAGEEDTIIAETIIATTRLVINATPESKNLFLSDKTGIGKDHTTKKTLDVIIPDDKHLHVTKMSKEAFTYWHAGEGLWTWDDKVLHLEDITQNLLNTSTFKVMSSGGSNAVVVRDQKTIEIPIHGKPVMILTSHHANPEDEALRRFPIGSCNETAEQTSRIFEKISKKYTKRSNNEPDYVFRYAIKNLKPYSVVIPFAELIQFFFPKDILMRTHYQRFLNYICASAVFHQYQREKTENNELIATPDDYMFARLVLIYTTSNPKMIPMSKEYRDILQIIQGNVAPMSVSEIFQKCDQSKIWLYRHLPKLVKTGLIVKGRRHDDNANKDITTYQYSLDENPHAIPTWKQMGDRINKIIEKTDKTDKTKIESIEANGLEKWFYHNMIKPIKPKKGDGFYLVFSGVKIPFNRKVFSVFSVFSLFLHERNEKRFSKYFKEALVENDLREQKELPLGKKTKDFFEKTDDELKCQIRDILSSKVKYQWNLDEIAFRCDLSGVKAKERVKSLLIKDIKENSEKSCFKMHDANGLRWSYRGDK